MDIRTARRFPAGCRRLTEPGRRALLRLTLTAVAATMLAGPAGAASPRRLPFWTKCSLDLKVAGVEVFPVEVLHLSCAQARHAIQHASILLTAAGPIFSTHGYTCGSTNILPRFDPSPFELPAAERCTGAKRRQLSFIWNFAK